MKSLLTVACMVLSHSVLATPVYECRDEYQDHAVRRVATLTIEQNAEQNFHVTIKEEHSAEASIVKEFDFEQCQQDGMNRNLILCTNSVLKGMASPIKLQTKVKTETYLDVLGSVVRDELHTSVSFVGYNSLGKYQEMNLRPFSLDSCH